ncbi:acidic leucine-rich nuclear phosphoprotein 32 family member A [Tanacetum coccineum]
MMKPEFSGDLEHVRLGLAADGLNFLLACESKFTDVARHIDNIQPHHVDVLKGNFLMLDDVNSTTSRSPAKDIDVYLQPLIKELQELWKESGRKTCYGKHSIFWDLEYWPFLLLKHNSMSCTSKITPLEALYEYLVDNDNQNYDKGKARLGNFESSKGVVVKKKPNGKLVKPHPKWMFPFERYMKKLKNYVRNKAKPEGSIAEGYVSEEALTFCSRYLKDDVETRFNRLGRNDDGLPEEEPDKFQVFRSVCKLTGRMKEWLTQIESPDNVETSFPAWFIYKIENPEAVVKSYSLGMWTISACTYPVCRSGCYPPVMMTMLMSNEDMLILLIMKMMSVAMSLMMMIVVVSDDDEVTLMACLAPRSHGGDAGGSPPRQPNRPVPAQCQSSSLRIETGNASLRKAFRHNNQQPLTLGFDYDDLGTFHPIGDYASMLNSLMGETIRPLPLACEWEEIPEAFKAHIFPTLESYFNLAEWYNNQEKVVVGKNVYTVGERVRLGLQLKLRLLWRKNKNRIKAQQYTIYDSPDEAKNHLPPSTVWGERTHDEWNELVDWFSHPNQVSRSMKNAANRAKNTIPTHQGKKSFAQGRNEYKVEKGHHEDLIQTWKKTHSNSKTGQFKYEENKQRYLKMKAMQDQIRAGVIPYKTDQEILDEVVPSDNRQNMSGMGRKLPGGGSTSRRRANQAFADVMTREQMTQILRQKEQENELLRKQAEEAQQRAYLAALKADTEVKEVSDQRRGYKSLWTREASAGKKQMIQMD